MDYTPSQNNKEISLNQNIHSDVLSVFDGNAHFTQIYKKTEKLITALYMVTNFIKEGEPLKWKIREKSLELLSLNISFNSVPLSERKEMLKKYQAYALEIVSLSGVAMHAGLISEMNGQILTREFTNLVSMINKDEHKKSNEETVILGREFFDIAAPKQPNVLYTPEIEKTAAPAITATPVVAEVEKKSYLSNPIHPVIKDIKEKAKPEARMAEVKDSKNDRQEAIIKLLSKKSGLSASDFVETIKGVSTKTIQRELLAMVATGVLKKEGERRWSTYSLATTAA